MQVIGRVSLQQTKVQKQTIAKKQKNEINAVKKMIEKMNKELAEHMKEKFGEKVSEALDKQKQLLENFLDS